MEKVPVYILTVICLAIFLAACNRKTKTEKTQSIDTTNPIEELAKKNFESDYKLTYNSTNEYVLVSKEYKIKKSDPMPTIRFELVQVEPLESLMTDAIPGGEIIWEDDFVLKVISKRGIPNPEGTGGPKTYRYHAKNRKKYSGNFFKNKN